MSTNGPGKRIYTSVILHPDPTILSGFDSGPFVVVFIHLSAVLCEFDEFWMDRDSGGRRPGFEEREGMTRAIGPQVGTAPG